MYGVISAELIRGTAWAARPHPWVARLRGLDPHWGFQREFVRGVYDYTYARGKYGGRGIYIYFALAPGVYEVYRPISWRSEERFFIRVADDGERHKIAREEVERWLNDTSA